MVEVEYVILLLRNKYSGSPTWVKIIFPSSNRALKLFEIA
jgi:hypothetical protein